MISDLRERITFLTTSTTQDSYGQAIDDEEEGDTVWASVIAGSPSESVDAPQQSTSTPYTIIIRFRSGIDAATRIGWRDRILDLVGEHIDPDGRRRFLEMKAVHNA